MLQSLMTCCPKPHAKERRIAQPFILQTLFHLKCDELTEMTRNSFLGSIRTKTSLPTSIRETAICRVAVLNKAWYEWESHSPILESAEGTYAPFTMTPPLLRFSASPLLLYPHSLTLTYPPPRRHKRPSPRRPKLPTQRTALGVGRQVIRRTSLHRRNDTRRACARQRV